MRRCIGEKIRNLYKVFIVAVPDNDDELLRVSYLPVLCINGTFYYDDNTAEEMDDWKTMKNALTPEWAEKNIIGYRRGMKLIPENGFSSYYGGTDKDAEKANEKLRNKLSGMTRYEYYNNKF